MLARGGGGFEDLLPFSEERLVRAVAGCPVPIVTAVGHEQDTPLCDLAADRRASTPTAAGRLVVPDLEELVAGLEPRRERRSPAERAACSSAMPSAWAEHTSVCAAHPPCWWSAGAPRSPRPQAACARSPRARPSNAATRSSAARANCVRSAAAVSAGDPIAVEVVDGRFGARVE